MLTNYDLRFLNENYSEKVFEGIATPVGFEIICIKLYDKDRIIRIADTPEKLIGTKFAYLEVVLKNASPQTNSN